MIIIIKLENAIKAAAADNNGLSIIFCYIYMIEYREK